MSATPLAAEPQQSSRADSARWGIGNRYEMRGELARGGMSRVYRVFDRLVGEERAMKRVTRDGSGSRFEIDALEREYAVLASLTHPRIIRVHDYGVDASGRFYTMDLLDGSDLRELAPVTVDQACRYLRDIATSLALLHARRLIHRDLSPGNVRATGDGHCKLIDFGALAAFGLSRVIVGTPPSIAPEALRREPLDQRSDLYSLGTLAYWMLTRRHAYPAKEIADLPALWAEPPPPPSVYSSEVPPALDALVMALIRANPLARPETAAEVIASLEVIGGLAAEDTLETERLAQSFLLTPRFVGRAFELRRVEAHVATCRQGKGAAFIIRAGAGLGRTRFIEEMALRAQLAGALVVRVDASAHRQTYGTARALVSSLVDNAPELVREHGGDFSALASLGLDLVQRFARPAPGEGRAPVDCEAPSAQSRRFEDASERKSGHLLPASPEAWLCAFSRARPLVLAVDNVEEADDGSLGFLFALAKLASEHALLLVVSERARAEPRRALGLVGLREQSIRIDLEPLNGSEVLELVLSIFGDVANSGRYAEWLFLACGGNPLHAIEICRQLAARQVLRYSGGQWSLPSERPDAELPAALGDALSERISALGPLARELAESLCLQEEQPTLALCQRLLPRVNEIAVRQRLDELALNGVLYADGTGYRFATTAIRDALIARMDNARLISIHKSLGEALAEGAKGGPVHLRLQAGWHLIQGGDEERGADLIASATLDSSTVHTLAANLHRIGKPVEAALLAYNRHRRTLYERLPLLCALAQAGWYEDRQWGVRHGDQAIDVGEDLTGFATARRARRFIGPWLALILGLSVAAFRFWLTPRRERQYSFIALQTHFIGAVCALAGAAAVALDTVRVGRVADVLEPLAVVPDRLTFKGIYQYCQVFKALGSENAALTYREATQLLRRFQDPHYYPLLSVQMRQFLIAAAHFDRASLGVLRAQTEEVFASAEALERMGFELYSMIGSQLRCLYHVMRGEFAQAAPYRVEVELHAARMGRLWLVETWESAALLALHVNMLRDVVGTTGLLHRLEAAARYEPSLGWYEGLARAAVALLRGEIEPQVAAQIMDRPAKSFLGWAASLGALARACNTAGRHAEALEFCQRARAHTTDADREFVTLFLTVDIEHAIARAGLGDPAGAIAEIDANLARFAGCNHPLVFGLLHEARATLCLQVGDIPGFQRSLAGVRQWFLPTGNPILLARHERLTQISDERKLAPLPTGPEPSERATTQQDLEHGIDDAFAAQVTAVEVPGARGAQPSRSPPQNSWTRSVNRPANDTSSAGTLPSTSEVKREPSSE